MKRVHGGDWAGFEEEYGCAPLDFSVNVSPLGVPDGVRRAVEETAAEADRYPDPLCRRLRGGIAEQQGIPAEWILCGNGAADLIFRGVLACRPGRALLTAPAFGEYEAALQAADCRITYYNLQEEHNFVPDERILEAISPDVDMVFLCQPGNPAGTAIPQSLLLSILERCQAAGALLVLDECFCDFLDSPEDHSLTCELSGSKNLLILRSFTKLYAMAGVRLGYCLSSDTDLLRTMALAGPPWSVSSLAQAAGLAALKEKDYVRQVRALVQTERPWLAAQLKKLGLRVCPGQANFLLFQCGVPLAEPLGKKGILLRECGSYRGLDDTWYRAAVRMHDENERLVRSLREVLSYG